MRNIPFVDLASQHRELRGEIDSQLARVLDANAFILGPHVAQFEAEFAHYCESPYAVGVDNGLSALELALRAHGIGPGDEVITVAHTYVATVAAICHSGAQPVLVEVDPVTRCMDVKAAERAISPRTKALLPVHLYGRPADLTALTELADAHNLLLLEDAAQSHGASHRGRRLGAWRDTACYSFYPGKNLGALGDGGMVVTRHAEVAETLRQLRDNGQRAKYQHVHLPFNRRLDALQAAVLSVKLPHLDRWNQGRQAAAQVYDQALQGLPELTLPAPVSDGESVYHLYVVEHPRRDWLLDELKLRGVHCALHYPQSVHQQPWYRDAGLPCPRLPVSERLAATVLSLPMHPHLSEDDAVYVADQLKSLLR